jgi:hypothetical protein
LCVSVWGFRKEKSYVSYVCENEVMLSLKIP